MVESIFEALGELTRLLVDKMPWGIATDQGDVVVVVERTEDVNRLATLVSGAFSLEGGNALCHRRTGVNLQIGVRGVEG